MLVHGKSQNRSRHYSIFISVEQEAVAWMEKRDGSRSRRASQPLVNRPDNKFFKRKEKCNAESIRFTVEFQTRWNRLIVSISTEFSSYIYISFVREFIIESLLLYCIIFLNVIGNVSEKFWKFEDLSCTLRSEKKFQSFVASKNLVPCANNLLFYIIHIRIIKDINDSWHTLHHVCAMKWLFAIVAAFSFLLHVLDTTILGSSHDSTKSPR